uniref:Uncharacterized protein n=1 Tax=Colobus angolensis palliatus TaxID=336983 RepID=A0A2K5I7F0_COLAP
MATSGRPSFTVRSLLDLPEQDAQHLPRREPEPRAPQPDPCAAWLDSERGHYPSSDESSLETSPPDSSQRPSVMPAQDKCGAPTAAACPLPGYPAFCPGSALGLFPAYQHLAPPALVSWNW